MKKNIFKLASGQKLSKKERLRNELQNEKTEKRMVSLFTKTVIISLLLFLLYKALS